jgi:hypothetical protein
MLQDFILSDCKMDCGNTWRVFEIVDLFGIVDLFHIVGYQLLQEAPTEPGFANDRNGL